MPCGRLVLHIRSSCADKLGAPSRVVGGRFLGSAPCVAMTTPRARLGGEAGDCERPNSKHVPLYKPGLHARARKFVEPIQSSYSFFVM